MQSFCDLETEKMNAARFAAPAPAAENSSTPSRTGRAGWLDQLAQALAPYPVDHMPIVPPHLRVAQNLVRSRRVPSPCG